MGAPYSHRYNSPPLHHLGSPPRSGAPNSVSARGHHADDGVRELRTTLHLNVAAASLRLRHWTAAVEACQYVLSEEPTNAKALYRLAKAHEGAHELGQAVAAASRLLKADPSNAEGQKLLCALKGDRAKERKMYSGLFERSAAAGGLVRPEENIASAAPPKTFDSSKLTFDRQMDAQRWFEEQCEERGCMKPGERPGNWVQPGWKISDGDLV